VILDALTIPIVDFDDCSLLDIIYSLRKTKGLYIEASKYDFMRYIAKHMLYDIST
jgi:hypothetical protein